MPLKQLTEDFIVSSRKRHFLFIAVLMGVLAIALIVFESPNKPPERMMDLFQGFYYEQYIMLSLVASFFFAVIYVSSGQKSESNAPDDLLITIAGSAAISDEAKGEIGQRLRTHGSITFKELLELEGKIEQTRKGEGYKKLVQ